MFISSIRPKNSAILCYDRRLTNTDGAVPASAVPMKSPSRSFHYGLRAKLEVIYPIGFSQLCPVCHTEPFTINHALDKRNDCIYLCMFASLLQYFAFALHRFDMLKYCLHDLLSSFVVVVWIIILLAFTLMSPTMFLKTGYPV
ncbi:uncharacterized protein PHALS_14556 [Plasmopara halstedii]|uniref:Uncharacterized protein n=1 Tax=Plasmopara halstedii TaxID=4781 RepID=A0A0P1AM08_PLAHL|nr:uncharacterized protein PHALS_14556 [Plasmopara halstedii]CEG41679.1 hypothetical protein PHALS_14556 [Plasmopara halstedii]|eukprot:XP_024578048.1 hypothetical protein PHALS_14556 [Plasmopara halstedii]